VMAVIFQNHPFGLAKKTPDLNNQKRFLRGAPDNSILTMEDDTVKDHTHGLHDPGHAHSYGDKYSKRRGQAMAGLAGDYNDGVSDHTRQSSSHSTGISVNGITESGVKGDETRPKNMHVTYIMKIW